MFNKRRIGLNAWLVALLVFGAVLQGVGGSVAKAADSIIYVKEGSSGAGTSWDNAFGTLQEGLEQASGGDEIWIANGTYYPSKDPGGNTVPSDPRTKTFQMTNGVKIYGGFEGNESTDFDLTKRDFTSNETILSGDLNKDNQIDDEDAYHVFYHPSVLDDTAVLDGVTITGGNANHSDNEIHKYGGGMYNYGGIPTLTNVTLSGNMALSGGGMYNDGSSPTLTNVTLSENTVSNHGGGMHNDGSSPTLTNVTISGNTAGSCGGGMLNNDLSNPILTNVTISGNTANKGGGICNRSGRPILTNVMISGNIASDSGGGMDNFLGGNLTLTNVTISGNTAVNGGGMYNHFSSGIYTRNSIIWGNSGASIINDVGSLEISSSLVQGLSRLDGSWNYELGEDYGNNLDEDPEFVNPANGDYRLKDNSPAIDKGDSSLVVGFNFDLDGNPRVMGSAVDMGAYEYDNSLPTITFGLNGSETSQRSASTTVTVNDDGSGVDEESLLYSWTQNQTPPINGANWTQFSNGDKLTKNNVRGDWYLHIQAADQAGNIAKVTSNRFRLHIPTSGGGFFPPTQTISPPGGTIQSNGIVLVFPEGAVSETVTIDVNISGNISHLPLPDNSQLLSEVFDIKATPTVEFNKPVTLTFPVNMSAIDFDAHDIAIYWLNEETNAWVRLDNIQIDREQGTVSGDVDRFAKFAILVTEKSDGEIEFSDIKGHWAEEFIRQAALVGIIKGYPDGTFKPNRHLTRAQTASLLVRALGLQTDEDSPFNDIDGYAKETQTEINAAFRFGLVNGQNGNFMPSKDITRAQIALMLKRAYEHKTGTKYIAKARAPFPDIENYDEETVNAITMLYELGIAEGSNGDYMPNKPTTRGQISKMLVNILSIFNN